MTSQHHIIMQICFSRIDVPLAVSRLEPEILAVAPDVPENREHYIAVEDAVIPIAIPAGPMTRQI